MKILGTGSYVPKGIIDNDKLSEFMDTSDEWIKERTGISQRHVSIGETVADMAGIAAKEALMSSRLDANEIDIIIAATCSPEYALPCVACQVQNAIGAENAVCFDLNAACAGFLFALNTVYSYIKSGIYKNALVIGAEGLSKIVDWTDRGTAILFGDGAGAVVVTGNEDADDYVFVQHAIGKKGNVLSCVNRDIKNPLYAAGEVNKYVMMDGREIFRFAVSVIPACIEEVLNKANVNAENVDLFLLHQANKRIIYSISKKFGGEDRFPTNVENVGNMSSASIPVLLDECVKSGRVKRGTRIVMSGFGAGLTYGASVMTF